ncbi:hypothetical protein KIN20_012441 [Parelaphostrongylus tenuis]|uniref:Uncharacterized protein n=1 Tax=Parelaphostrongylus tenuis TaxID=148309 RepID=A0AAD5MTA9_PARTN|nr:hypothetical protein KIN20_012441 [Parelaphostrongylus tenuis]
MESRQSCQRTVQWKLGNAINSVLLMPGRVFHGEHLPPKYQEFWGQPSRPPSSLRPLRPLRSLLPLLPLIALRRLGD